MSYSRRQLYAMGEPLGDSATRREVGGKIIYGSGGGGGNAEKQTTIVDLPEWAKPYAKESLGKASALTASPYQAYGGERVAQFSPLQKQAFDAAAQQQVASQIGFGSGLAGLTGTSSFRDQGTAAGFMSPYMQQVVDQQMASAQRQADIAATQRGAQAVRAGAFGGSRQAVENAEANRALASQKGEIQAKGLQSAYEQAQNQFNQEQGQRLNAAQALGQLGTQQFGQQMDITGRQAQFGADQRAATQEILSNQYQDFLNQQRAPYDQLAFMSSIIRGTPMGQTTTQYQPPANQTSQLIGLGTAAAGAYGAYQGAQKAAGGEVKGYAAGGDIGIGALMGNVGSLSDAQLGQMQEGGKPPLTAAIVAEEILRRQALREDMEQQQAMMNPAPQTTVAEEQLASAGLPGLPAGNLDRMGEATMAGGGIIAFSTGNEVVGNQYDAARLRYSQALEALRSFGSRQQLADREGYQAAVAAEAAAKNEMAAAKKAWEGVAAGNASGPYLGGRPSVATPTPTPAATPTATPTTPTPARTSVMETDPSKFLGIGSAANRTALNASNRVADAKAVELAAAKGTPTAEKPAPTGDGSGAANAGLSALKTQTAAGVGELKKQVEAINAARTAAANSAVERAKTQEAELGEYGVEESKRLEKREKALEGAEDKNFNMALIEAGLAMMSGTSANAFENIGKGAMVGTKAYTTGIERIQSRKEKLDEAVIALENAKRGDKRVSQERMDRLQANVDNAATANAEALYNFGSKTLDMSREDARFATQIAVQKAQIAATNRTPAEIQLIERVMAEKKIPFSEAMAVVAGTKRAPVDTEKLRGEWLDMTKRMQINRDYPNVKTFDDYVTVMGSGGVGGTSPFKFMGSRPAQ